MSLKYEIVVATDESLRAACFRLRYDVFCVEEGDDRYCDHASQTMSDLLDQRPHVLLAARDEKGEVIGTCRLTLRRDGPFINDEFYRMSEIAEQHGLNGDAALPHFMLWDRVVLAKNWRRSGLFTALAARVEQEAQQCDALFVIGAVNTRKANIQRAFRILGFKQSHEAGQAFRGIVLVKRLSSQ